MKAISLHQPWASLLVTRQPCELCPDGLGMAHGFKAQPMVKRFETRSWPCPPALIGQPIAIHATKQEPRGPVGDFEVYVSRPNPMLPGLVEKPTPLLYAGKDADDCHRYLPLPLGAVVGSGRITASLDIVEGPSFRSDAYVSTWPDGRLFFGGEDISDQLPYGDFTPGRYAWLVEDAAPCTERCPWCWGSGRHPKYVEGPPCPVCRVDICMDFAPGRCDPIPARGHQRIWNCQPL